MGGVYYFGLFIVIVGVCLFATPFFAVFGLVSDGLSGFDGPHGFRPEVFERMNDPDFAKPPKGVFGSFGLAFIGVLAIGAGSAMMRYGREPRPMSDEELEDWADPGPTS
jgi:hypothetical protein